MNRAWLVALVACGGASAKPAPLGNRVDAPSGGSVALTWVVAPPSVKHPMYEDILLRPLALEVTIDGAPRSIKLEAMQGSLFSQNQTVCKTDAYPLEPTEVGKITFYEGGAGGYAVQRKLEGTLVLIAWSLTDGACEGPGGEPVSCPRYEKAVTSVEIPPHATIREAIVEVDAQGVRAPFSCAEP